MIVGCESLEPRDVAKSVQDNEEKKVKVSSTEESSE